MAKKPSGKSSSTGSTATEKPRSADLKPSPDPEQPKKQPTAELTPARQPQEEEKAAVSALASSLAPQPPVAGPSAAQMPTAGTTKPAAPSAAEVPPLIKKDTAPADTDRAPAKASPPSAKVPSSSSEPAVAKPAPGVEAPPAAVTNVPDKSPVAEQAVAVEPPPVVTPAEVAPAQPQSVHVEEPPPVEEPASAEEMPETVAAPAQPQSVHVEEPLPAEEPVYVQTQAPTVHHVSNLFIVQIAPEMAPVAKVGGLADVVFGLTRELAIRGNHVETILPKYDNLRYDHIYNLHVDYQDLWVPWYEGAIHCTVYFGLVYDRRCYFIEPHSQDNFFNRGSIYGFNDDVMRYAFFSRAAMEYLWKAGKHPDIIHCHDWQTALVPVFLYEFYQRMGMTHPRACLTIHNFQHQGVTGGELLRATGLNDPQRFFDYNRMRDNHHPSALNLLKGGIVYSNFITTVSPRYAFETADQGQGFGLEPTLHTHHTKYGGVINGVDYDVWNPEIDRYLPTRYGVNSIDGKYDNKRALRHRFMLAESNKPIVAFIGRLDPQKGLDLVRHAIFYAMERGAQFVLLGSSPDQRINGDFWGLKHMLNDSPDCHLEIGFNEELSHLIYAGSDMMLVPSKFEPCGLTQLVSLRYGTIPVVRSVGGLADTVFDKDYSNRPLHERNGYVFDNYDQAGLESALGRAIACYFEYPDHFRELIKNAMSSDYSWNQPGRDYLNIYDYIREK